MTAECFLDANVLVYAVSKAPAEANKKKRALRTMPEEMAIYKGIAPARERIVGLLGGANL